MNSSGYFPEQSGAMSVRASRDDGNYGDMARGRMKLGIAANRRDVRMSGWEDRLNFHSRLALAPEYVPGRTYSRWHLSIMADKILYEAAQAEGCKSRFGHGILCRQQLIDRKKREIYVNTGVPDPSIASGLYFRSHPQGRRVNSPEARKKNGAGYYR